MARRKATPDRSTIVRTPTVAPARRQRGEGDGDDGGDDGPPAAAPAGEKKQDETAPLPMKPGDAKKPDQKADAPKSDDAVPLEAPRAKTETIAMPGGEFGRPPEMPQSVAPPPLAQIGAIENPTHMPGPKDIPSGEPGDPASAPGLVPRGDSRSLRRGNEFALIYRISTYVISRLGSVGQRGQWRVVEYPTSSFAGTAYAKECSRFVSEGFSDYRE
ncbi:MAG TPA: hypothetical protein VH143_27145 [Kofleriaceae bacterium]|jgi:hypothetical protein|nr:hypothetical protein [Kofleriaceae bacterium]